MQKTRALRIMHEIAIHAAYTLQVLNLPPDLLKKRGVDWIDISADKARDLMRCGHCADRLDRCQELQEGNGSCVIQVDSYWTWSFHRR